MEKKEGQRRRRKGGSIINIFLFIPLYSFLSPSIVFLFRLFGFVFYINTLYSTLFTLVNASSDVKTTMLRFKYEILTFSIYTQRKNVLLTNIY